MPSLQVVDTTPRPSEPTTFEKTLGSFVNKHRQNRQEESERSTLEDIYKQYQSDADMIDKSIQAVQTRPGLSPSKRVETVNHLMQLKKMNTEASRHQEGLLEKQKVADEKIAKEKVKTEKEQGERERVKKSVYELYKGVLPEDEAARRSEFDTEETARRVVEQRVKVNKQDLEEKKDFEDVESAINSLVDTLEEGNVGLNVLNKATAKGRESRAYFDEQALRIEKRLATMVGKGTLSQARFNYLKQNLPQSKDSDATNRGRLRALAEEFGVKVKNENFASPKKKKAPEKKVTAQVVSETDKLPDAASFAGKTIKNPATGERMRSDGKTWSPV